MIRFIRLLQAPPALIYPVVQKAKFLFLWYEKENNNNNNNNNNKIKE